MPYGTSYIPDLISHASGGVTSSLTASQLASKFGAANVKTPTKNFSFCYNGHHISGRAGVPFVVDVGLAAALAAANAPVV